MKIGPNQQAVVDALPGRPAEIIAETSNETQAVFRALFNGAQSPGKINENSRLTCGAEAADSGWPARWLELQDLGLITFRVKQSQRRSKIVILKSVNAECDLHWQITPDGWTVRIDDIAWMTEFMAAKQADEATRQ